MQVAPTLATGLDVNLPPLDAKPSELSTMLMEIDRALRTHFASVDGPEGFFSVLASAAPYYHVLLEGLRGEQRAILAATRQLLWRAGNVADDDATALLAEVDALIHYIQEHVDLVDTIIRDALEHD